MDSPCSAATRVVKTMTTIQVQRLNGWGCNVSQSRALKAQNLLHEESLRTSEILFHAVSNVAAIWHIFFNGVR
jgi:hypothetical protein